MVVQLDVTGNGVLEVFAAGELVTSQHLLDAVVEVLDHAVGLRALRAVEAMLDARA
jgi:hypothetical protein